MPDTTQASTRFERWKGLNLIAMVVGTFIAYFLSSRLPPSTPAFMTTLVVLLCLFIVAAPIGFRSMVNDNDIPLRERYTLGTLITLIVVVAGSMGGQMYSLANLLRHTM